MTTGRDGGNSRRRLVIGAAGLAALSVAGGLFYGLPRLTVRRYPPTPYDDLLSQLGDRDSAAKLGDTVLRAFPQFDPKAAAQALRQGAGKGSLKHAIEDDLAHGRLSEVHGWLLPQTLVTISAIAARSRRT